jgi:hypothetical protein
VVADSPEIDPDGIHDTFVKDIRTERVDHATRIVWRVPVDGGKAMKVRAKIIIADADLAEVVLALAQVVHSRRRA